MNGSIWVKVGYCWIQTDPPEVIRLFKYTKLTKCPPNASSYLHPVPANNKPSTSMYCTKHKNMDLLHGASWTHQVSQSQHKVPAKLTALWCHSGAKAWIITNTIHSTWTVEAHIPVQTLDRCHRSMFLLHSGASMNWICDFQIGNGCQL